MKTMETVEPGIFRRVDPRSGKVLPTLWVHYPGTQGRTERESAQTTSIVAARKFRAKRMEEQGRGEPGRVAEKVRVGALLDALLTNYELNDRGSLRTLRSHLKVLRPAFGHLRAIDLTTDVVERWQLKWQQAGTTNATINRRGNMLRRAFNLARRARKVHLVPYIPRLEEFGIRTRYISETDMEKVTAQLAPHLRDFLGFAYDFGTRKGQLTRTLRRHVDLERGIIEWPAREVKARDAHTIPMDEKGIDIVTRLMTKPPLHCPFLFHGARCKPGRKPSKEYGCVGDFKKAWAGACKRAGVVAGRKTGGIVFHGTRVAAPTNLRAGGMPEADCMLITGHKTAHIFRHYDLGDVETLRTRLAQARGTQRGIVTPIRGRAGQK